MKLKALSFQDFVLNFVGTDKNITIFDRYIDSWQENDKKGLATDVNDVLNKVVDYRLYCFARAATFRGRRHVKVINAFLKEYNLYLTEDEYIEAMCLSNPKKSQEIFKISESEFNDLLKNSRWMNSPEPFDTPDDK